MRRHVLSVLVLCFSSHIALGSCVPQACYVLEFSTYACADPAPAGPPPLGGPRASHFELKVSVNDAVPVPCHPGEKTRTPASGERERVLAIKTAYYETFGYDTCAWFLSHSAKLFLPEVCCDSPARVGTCALPGPVLVDLPPQALP